MIEDVDYSEFETCCPYPERDRNDLLTKLTVIETKGRSMGMQMRKEAAVARQELADRQRKGLTGDAAIAHYNEWMQRYGMEHLMVKEAKA